MSTTCDLKLIGHRSYLFNSPSTFNMIQQISAVLCGLVIILGCSQETKTDVDNKSSFNGLFEYDVWLDNNLFTESEIELFTEDLGISITNTKIGQTSDYMITVEGQHFPAKPGRSEPFCTFTVSILSFKTWERFENTLTINDKPSVETKQKGKAFLTEAAISGFKHVAH